jgi:hypothetical protein
MEYSFDFLVSEVFPYFFADATKIQSSEHNYLALLYHHMLTAGLSPSQVCREMYTGGQKQRPDIVVFSPDIDGRFNLYKDGNTVEDNTPIKRKHMQCLIEMKGGAHLSKQALDRPEDLIKDIHKLSEWKRQFEVGDYIFLALNLRGFRGPIRPDQLSKLAEESMQRRINFIYFLQGQPDFLVWRPQEECRKISLKILS